MGKNEIDEFSDEETARRRDAALLRALGTPHKKQSEMKIGKKGRQPAESAPKKRGRRKKDQIE